MNLLQDNEYKHWLKGLKQKVLQSQLKTVVKINSTLLEFYWELGEDIVQSDLVDIDADSDKVSAEIMELLREVHS